MSIAHAISKLGDYRLCKRIFTADRHSRCDNINPQPIVAHCLSAE